jgi:hypothetical protein
MQMILGLLTTQAISVAARRDLADLLNDGAKGVEELAYRVSPSAMRTTFPLKWYQSLILAICCLHQSLRVMNATFLFRPVW